MKRKPIVLVLVMGLAAGVQPALAEWQCLSAGAKVPAAAQAASNYLERAEHVYPTQLLGLMRAGNRVYLVNARDDGWSERVRQGLMELRLAEPDITAARRFQATLSGGPRPDASGLPAGEFVCLERGRAARQGLVFRGEAVLLTEGKSVHLVDPMELGIVVEVKAVGGEPLDLREIFAASARAGIYAGLFRGRAQSGPVVAVRPPESPVTFPVGPIGRPDGEVVIMARAPVVDTMDDAVAAVGATHTPSLPEPAAVLAATAQPVVEQPPARVAVAEVPVAPALVKPLSQEIPAAVAIAEPAPVAAPATREVRPVTVAAPAPPAAEQPPARIAVTEIPVTSTPVKPLPQEFRTVVAVAEPAPVAVPPAQEARPVVVPAPAPPAAEQPPARVATADVTVVPPPAKPLTQEIPAAAVVAVAEPVRIPAPAAQAIRPVAEQSYEEYAKTMKTLLALKRSGAVRSISEMTYVHPAVEDLRAGR